MRGNLKAALLFLLTGLAAGSFAKADSFDYKYTLHINGVVLPGDGLPMPSIELAFLTQDDVSAGPPALYLTEEYTQNVEVLYLRESGGRSNPFYLDPFSGDYSGFNVSVDSIFFIDEWWPAGRNDGPYVGQYGTDDFMPVLTPNLPAPGQMTSGPIYGTSPTYENPDGSYETALTSYTLRLNIVPEPSPASMLALGLIGIVALMPFRKLPRR